MDMTMSSIRLNRVEVVTSVQRRRRWPDSKSLILSNRLMNQEVLFLWQRENMDSRVRQLMT